MAKKQILPERNRNSKTPDKTITRSSNSPKITAKNSSRNRNGMAETANGDVSSEETAVSVVPSSSAESVNDEVADSSAAEDEGAERRSSSEEEEAEEEEKLESIRKRCSSGKKDDERSKGKKRSRKEKDELEAEEKRESALYTFPMKRISQIIKSDNPDVRISQEAVFLINKASEKFLQLFTKEAYACAFLDKKKHTAYNHLSEVVSKRKRFEFLSDIVPEKVKAEDALAQLAEDDK